MAKFMVVKSPEPAVITLERDDFKVEGNMETGEVILNLLNRPSVEMMNIPKEDRFDDFRSGSTFGSLKTWVGDTDNPEDVKRLEEVMGN